MSPFRSWSRLLVLAPVLLVMLGCLAQGSPDGALHRWWSGLGPALPHDTFPGDCKLCHVGQTWNELRADFQFDHARVTGVVLEGAHAKAQCLRCHNDRGPVQTFQARGCVGCHEDVHQGGLGKDCKSCHDQQSWFPNGQHERHDRSRFPLTGAHMAVSCHRCHPGIAVGRVYPVDSSCVSCHQAEMVATTNPPHVGLGWVDRCDRCHFTTSWNHARTR